VDEDANLHEDDISLSIIELPLDFHCGDSLIMDMVHIDYKGELDLDSCEPRYRLTTFVCKKKKRKKRTFVTQLSVHSV